MDKLLEKEQMGRIKGTIPLFRKRDHYEETVITLHDETLKKQLVRKGYEIVGDVFDNVTKPRIYTMFGYKCLISERELAGVSFVGQQRFNQSSSKLYNRPSSIIRV